MDHQTAAVQKREFLQYRDAVRNSVAPLHEQKRDFLRYRDMIRYQQSITQQKQTKK